MNHEQFSQALTLALDGINKTLIAIAELPIPKSKRNALAVTLLRASMDHGRAVAVLASSHLEDFGASAIALHRTQVDTMFRGAFFADSATDDEIAYFLDNDEMPKRPGPDGKPKRLSPKDLAGLIGNAVSAESTQKLINYMDRSWGLLCGMVHGGMSTVLAYHNAQIGFQVTPEEMVEVVANALALNQLAMIAVANVSKVEAKQLSDLFQAPHAAQKAYHEYIKANP